MAQITEHFSLEEMTVNSFGLPNIPNVTQLKNLLFLCSNLEKIRAHFGKPITINSGFRNPAVNAKVGGAKTSQHLEGIAADIECKGVSNKELWEYIVYNMPFDQCIAEFHRDSDPSAGWVHYSVKQIGNRSMAMSCIQRGIYEMGYNSL